MEGRRRVIMRAELQHVIPTGCGYRQRSLHRGVALHIGEVVQYVQTRRAEAL